MKVAFIQLPHFYNNEKRPATTYPLGIGYLASSLKEDHHLVPVDLWVENADVDRAMRMVSADIPDVFCVSTYSTQYPYYKEFVEALKRSYPNKKIIAGGPGATFSYNVFLEKTPTDYCVIGEGDRTLKELLDKIDDPEGVDGIAYKKAGAVVLTKKREQIQDLDSIPWPDRDFFDMERYILNEQRSGSQFPGLRSSNLIAGRGCPYDCTFCSRTFYGSRFRSIRDIQKEIEHLKSAYSLGAVAFNDELVLINKKRTLELCSILKEIDIKWYCQGRINLVDEEILRAMKGSGCMRIGYGIESYTQRILDRMKKQIKAERILPAIEITKRVGIEPVIQYMYGFPGEDDDSIERTAEFFEKADHPYVGFTTTPIPGTELYRQAMKDNLIGDEEAYLYKLTSGFTMLEPLVNMTDFTYKDFVLKKLNLAKRVNSGYYKRHPLAFLKYSFKEVLRISKVAITNPRVLFSRIKQKMLRAQGRS